MVSAQRLNEDRVAQDGSYRVNWLDFINRVGDVVVLLGI